MARVRRVAAERESTPAPGNVGEDLAAQVAKVFAADAAPAPLPMSGEQHAQVAGAVLGQSIHYVVDMQSMIDVTGNSFLCGANPGEGKRVVIVAPLDDPRWCPKCMGCRPSARGSSVRIVTVLHSR